MLALRDMGAGEELLLTYTGVAMTNTQLLVNYGFALHTNEFEGVALDLGLLRTDPLFGKCLCSGVSFLPGFCFPVLLLPHHSCAMANTIRFG